MIRETKPHQVVAVVDKGGEVRLDLVCPYNVGEDRPCMLGLEPARCDWIDYDNGAHHDDCPAAKDRAAACSAGELDALNLARCWPAPPEECDGWSASDVGHVHEASGCWAQWIIGEWGGWGEAIRWHPPVDQELTIPIDVSVSCDDDGVTIALWTPTADTAGA